MRPFCGRQVGEFGGDNRAGIDRTLHRISCMRNRTGRIIGLTCRVGRAIKGSAQMVRDLVLSGGRGCGGASWCLCVASSNCLTTLAYHLGIRYRYRSRERVS